MCRSLCISCNRRTNRLPYRHSDSVEHHRDATPCRRTPTEDHTPYMGRQSSRLLSQKPRIFLRSGRSRTDVLPRHHCRPMAADCRRNRHQHLYNNSDNRLGSPDSPPNTLPLSPHLINSIDRHRITRRHTQWNFSTTNTSSSR